MCVLFLEMREALQFFSICPDWKQFETLQYERIYYISDKIMKKIARLSTISLIVKVKYALV